MKIIKDIGEFNRITDPAMDTDFEMMDIIPSTKLGIFDRHRLQELLNFCRLYPEYHIISLLKDAPIKVNSAVENAALYLLGQGDSDPELMCVPVMDKKDFDLLQILKFDAS